MKKKHEEKPPTEQEIYDAHTEYVADAGEIADRVDAAKRAHDHARVDRLMDYHTFVRAQRRRWLEERAQYLPAEFQTFLRWYAQRQQAAPTA